DRRSCASGAEGSVARAAHVEHGLRHEAAAAHGREDEAEEPRRGGGDRSQGDRRLRERRVRALEPRSRALTPLPGDPYEKPAVRRGGADRHPALSDRIREKERARSAERGARDNIRLVVLVRIDAAPADVSREHVSRPRLARAVAVMEERCRLERHRCVPGRERIVVRAVGPLVVDDGLQQQCRADVRGEGPVELPASFPIIPSDGDGEGRGRQRNAQRVAGCLGVRGRGAARERQRKRGNASEQRVGYGSHGKECRTRFSRGKVSDTAFPSHQERPTVSPFQLMSMYPAAGCLGRPGIVIMSPPSTTMNSEPAERYTSRTLKTCPLAAPQYAGSVENEYCVFAMQIGKWP